MCGIACFSRPGPSPIASLLVTETREASGSPRPVTIERVPSGGRAVEQRTRLWAVLAAVVGIVASIAMPFLPVTQTTATIDWPQSESNAGISAPLVSYAPVDLDATIECRSVRDALPDGGTVFSTLPAGAPDRERYGLIARVRPAGDDGPAVFEVISRNTLLASAPVDDLAGDCSVTLSSNSERTVATITGSAAASGSGPSTETCGPSSSASSPTCPVPHSTVSRSPRPSTPASRRLRRC